MDIINNEIRNMAMAIKEDDGYKTMLLNSLYSLVEFLRKELEVKNDMKKSFFKWRNS